MGRKGQITDSEIEYLKNIDIAITSAVIRVDRTRLRKYLRNWVTELSRQEQNETPYIREPKKI